MSDCDRCVCAWKQQQQKNTHKKRNFIYTKIKVSSFILRSEHPQRCTEALLKYLVIDCKVSWRLTTTQVKVYNTLKSNC